MTFCSVQFPHESWGKQRRIMQCPCYSTLIAVFHVNTGKMIAVCAGLCACTMDTQHIQKRIAFAQYNLLLSNSLIQKNVLMKRKGAPTVFFFTFTCANVHENVHVAYQPNTLLCTFFHVWVTTFAIRHKPQSDVQCAEYVLMFVCLVSVGKARIVQK